MLRLTDSEFSHIVNFVKQNYGINLTQKRVLVEGRLATYIEQKGHRTFADYIKALEADHSGREITNLLNKITTNHTFFMRESAHFDFLRDTVLPYMERTVRDRDLRTWCAASSSGEEPYTLAMILRDYFGAKQPPWDTRLLATDLSIRVLEMARHGVYAQESIKDVPRQWKSKYFTKYDGDNVQVTQAIKNEVDYRQFNLMDKITAKKPFNIVFCRNVMIYFDAPTKAAVVERIYNAMAPGGYLFVGLTESIAKPTPFQYVMPSVYQKGV